MSNRAERQAEDAYERENDADAPVSGDYYDNSYAYESGEGGKFSMGVPVQRDEEEYEDPMQPPFSNTQEQLERDEREAIDKSNIMKGGLRHAKPRYKGGYNEGPDEDDLPAEVEETGQSDTRRVI
ncbi:hypothetical protein BJX68DRAFT_262151 [Aspergillus pseudodeflectus]|uniref:Histone chaperone domain-containing protein n=1 Tax=Aspergillus pseudodeflectus TaxID=176178 RepID=A0ABR4L5C3_9EURO